ncbi:MAG: S-methyl-5-thioribose-1-phosphate isomerase [Candidatus Saelkia tenebricola]|nr:S-methyl-5-thioribose-1-phosphate isomerase [Candidatus Saelkia tenebricola]
MKHIKWNGCVLSVLDQKMLPLEMRWIKCRDLNKIFLIIRDMNIRGAPLIGIVAAFGVVLHIKKGRIKDIFTFDKRINEAVEVLSKSRPTAINLYWALDRMKKVFDNNRDKTLNEIVCILEEEALSIWQEDIDMSHKMAGFGADFINDGDGVLTHCNAGGLATGGYGTALGVFFKAKENGVNFLVYVDETRPVLQGARLTAWELKQAGIKYRLITDNMSGFLMKQGRINKVFVGADRIVKNGGFANKIGTYSVAQLAKIHNIPFYVVAPSTSFDLTLSSEGEIPIEERDSKEIIFFNNISIAPVDSNVENPAFDITPPSLITVIITEKGVINSPFQENIAKIFKLK